VFSLILLNVFSNIGKCCHYCRQGFSLILESDLRLVSIFFHIGECFSSCLMVFSPVSACVALLYTVADLIANFNAH
jgi:hypothetical protein